MVAIIDDREDVWGACPNLVHVKPYIFFAGTSDINSPPTTSQHPNALTLMRNVIPYEPNDAIKLSRNESIKLETVSGITVSNSNSNNVGDKGEYELKEGAADKDVSRVIEGDSEGGLSGNGLNESREDQVGRVAGSNGNQSSSSSDSSSDSSSSDSSEDDSEGEDDSASIGEIIYHF